jgi:hypothetical protein
MIARKRPYDGVAEHAHAADRFAGEIIGILTHFCGALAAAEPHR